MQIRKDKDEEIDNLSIKKPIVPRTLQERYQLKLDEVLHNSDLYDKLKQQISVIKKRRIHKQRKRQKMIDSHTQQQEEME